MATFTPTIYTSIKAESMGVALRDLKIQLQNINTGSTIHLVDIMKIGDGKYYQPYLIYG